MGTQGSETSTPGGREVGDVLPQVPDGDLLSPGETEGVVSGAPAQPEASVAPATVVNNNIVVPSLTEPSKKATKKKTKKPVSSKGVLLVAGVLLLFLSTLVLGGILVGGYFVYAKVNQTPPDYKVFRMVENFFIGKPSARTVPINKTYEVVPYYTGNHFVEATNGLGDRIRIFQYVRTEKGLVKKEVAPILKPGETTPRPISCSGLSGVNLWYETVDFEGNALEDGKTDQKTFLFTKDGEGIEGNPFKWEII